MINTNESSLKQRAALVNAVVESDTKNIKRYYPRFITESGRAREEAERARLRKARIWLCISLVLFAVLLNLVLYLGITW